MTINGYDPARDGHDSFLAAIEAKKARGDRHDWNSAPRQFLDGKVELRPGDCRDVIRAMADNSVDSVVTDPPYLLTSIVQCFGADGAAPAQYGTDGRFARLSGGFMNQHWDAPTDAHGISVFEGWLAGFIAGEGCFRIQSQKEGTYYTCQFTIHLRADDAPILLACQKRLGGRIVFQDERESKQGIKSKPDVRWLVESRRDCLRLAGILDRVPLFAKKANDYALWRRGLDLWINTPRGNRWHGPRDVSEMAALHRQLQEVKRWDGISQIDLNFDPFMPPAQAFHYHWAREAYRVLKPGAHLVAFGASRTFHRLVCAIEDAGFEIRDTIGWLFGSGFPKSHNVGNGLGTALKPAMELICLARKPLIGTVAENVLAHGTGAINVDGCRVATDENTERYSYEIKTSKGTPGGAFGNAERVVHLSDMPIVAGGSPLGRWPANIVHDGSAEVLAGFPETASGTKQGGQYQRESGVHDGGQRLDGTACFADSGSAARFFYTAKADQRTRLGARHPTVKPLDLMQWLVRLVTPKGGLVLDPFAGTGTTGEAAWREGMRAILIEKEADSCADIKIRMSLAKEYARREAIAKTKRKLKGAEGTPLFPWMKEGHLL